MQGQANERKASHGKDTSLDCAILNPKHRRLCCCASDDDGAVVVGMIGVGLLLRLGESCRTTPKIRCGSIAFGAVEAWASKNFMLYCAASFSPSSLVTYERFLKHLVLRDRFGFASPRH